MNLSRIRRSVDCRQRSVCSCFSASLRILLIWLKADVDDDDADEDDEDEEEEDDDEDEADDFFDFFGDSLRVFLTRFEGFV